MTWVGELGQLLVGIGAVLTAGALVWSHRQVAAKVDAVRDEVKTGNGITLAMLADRAEGRRIQTEVEPADRTSSEARYVDDLIEGGRDGHGQTRED